MALLPAAEPLWLALLPAELEPPPGPEVAPAPLLDPEKPLVGPPPGSIGGGGGGMGAGSPGGESSIGEITDPESSEDSECTVSCWEV
jgi:hypothetical protein